MPDSFIRQLHDSPWQFAIAMAGGGSLALSDLLTTPGASKTVLEAVVPYSSNALVHFLKHTPEQFCSERTARRMAMAAYLRARDCVKDANLSTYAGIACTASLASNRPKQGEHRFHWAIQTQEMTVCGNEILEKGKHTRKEEERLLADLLLNEIFHWAGIAEHENEQRRQVTASCGLTELMFGSRKTLSIQGNSHKPQFLFSGSFDPIHEGHRRMMEIVCNHYSTNIALEIAVHNVDKPSLDYIDIQDRLDKIGRGTAVWLSQLSTFEAKATAFDHTTFVVGTDTLKRIGQPQYYRHGFDAAMETIRQNGCRFLCFARRSGNVIETLQNISLPDSLRKLCDSVPSDIFCEDICSTELRKKT